MLLTCRCGWWTCYTSCVQVSFMCSIELGNWPGWQKRAYLNPNPDILRKLIQTRVVFCLNLIDAEGSWSGVCSDELGMRMGGGNIYNHGNRKGHGRALCSSGEQRTICSHYVPYECGYHRDMVYPNQESLWCERRTQSRHVHVFNLQKMIRTQRHRLTSSPTLLSTLGKCFDLNKHGFMSADSQKTIRLHKD